MALTPSFTHGGQRRPTNVDVERRRSELRRDRRRPAGRGARRDQPPLP
ncbi:hypothetical protein SCE1572_23910 [Sorangium cellulosum So0157-2]|uniref:Uncharacterized protein n=1 Tax=Sorangium cellulosum So0157-2 TaxID=1254432 RepID=S4XY17_SORCE|nr:hypothetical protein SCE1572_23910 [Sorangium cellulosum So0157-2]